MTTQSPTLADLLTNGRAATPEAAADTEEGRTNGGADDGRLGPVRAALIATGQPWSFWRAQLADKLKAMLSEVKVEDVLLDAWSKAEEVKKQMAETRTSGTTVLTHMAEHTISSTVQPELEIVINDQPRFRLDLEVTLTLRLAGLTLKIEKGRIRELYAGECDAKALVKLADRELLKTKLGRVELPIRIPVDRGPGGQETAFA